MTNPSPSQPRQARLGGLDGLRAIAVVMVLVYHFFPRLLPGGFLGVDVFFAISGFLITTLLLTEYAGTGRLRLVAFWRRRARRLLPALGIVLLVCTAVGLAIGGDVLVRIGAQFAGAALFVSNWVFIANGTDYFARDTPELFRNTWSLSIEEQFYLVLPFVLIFAARLRHRSTRVLLFSALGVASAALMAALSFSGAEPTRIYFGSDTHTFGLLLGAALACLVHRDSSAALRFPALRQWGLGAVALAGLAVLAVLAATLREGSPESFRWGFQLATVAALAVVWAISRPGALVGRSLDVAPMRWIGERSYGIYLWHWPLLLLVSAALGPWARTPAGVWTVGGIALLLTIAAAALSYRFVEQPVRRLGLIRSLRLMLRPSTAKRRTVSIALAALLLATIPTTVIAIANAPSVSTAADAINRGQAALDQRGGQGQQTAPPKTPDTPDDAGGTADERCDRGDHTSEPSNAPAGPTGTGKADPGKPDADKPDVGKTSTDKTDPGKTDTDKAADTSKKTESPPADTSAEKTAKKPAPCLAPPVIPVGGDIGAVGDSVMLASVPELDEAFPGIWVDAAVSRGMGAGVGLIADLAAQNSLRPILVVGLGTNGTVDPAELDELRRLAGNRWIVLMTGHAERDWIPGVNQTLAEFAAAHRGVVLADWNSAIAPHPEALAGDGIHPEPSGGEIYAGTIREAIAALQRPDESVGFGAPRR